MRTALCVVEKEANADFKAKLAEHDRQVAAAEVERDAWHIKVKSAVKKGNLAPEMPPSASVPDRPVPRSIYVGDATTEKLLRILAADPGGLLVYRDELSGFFGSFDRYKNGKADRPFWLECFGGRPYRYDRVTLDESIDIPACAVSVIGGIQPDILAKLLQSNADDGLISRFIFAWPDPVPQRRPNSSPDQEKLIRALRRLQSLLSTDKMDSFQPSIMRLTSDAADIFQTWYEAEAWQELEAASGLLASAFGKLNGLVLRLAGVLEFIHWSWDCEVNQLPAVVSERSVEFAIQLVESWVRPTLRRVYAEAAITVAERDVMNMARWLLSNPCDLVNVRDLRREGGCPMPREAKEADAVTEILVAANWLLPDPVRNGDTAGRPRKNYQVNPLIYVEECHGG